MRPDTLSNRFRRLIEENNLPPLTFHGLRHSCASILLSQGCSIKQIQDWLGHEDIQTTADIYSHRILISNRNRQQKYERKATLFGRREGFLSARLFEINMCTVQKQELRIFGTGLSAKIRITIRKIRLFDRPSDRPAPFAAWQTR